MFKRVSFTAVLFLLLAGCLFDPKANVGNSYLNKSYGPAERNKLDMYLPGNSDSTTATVVLIHGGGWVAGNKTDWDKELIGHITAKGYAVACINYQYANGNYHNQIQDIELALKYINDNSSVWKISRQKFGLIGASAGGHLSLLYAHAFDSLGQVKAVVSLAGPTDMTDPLFHQYAGNYAIGYVFEQFLGSTQQNNPQVYIDASPLFYHKQIPTLFIHGSLDNLVPPAQGRRMFDSLQVYGVTSDTIFFANAGHDVTGPNQVNKTALYNRVDAWMDTYLR
jgi:acetyl esterase/lipase